MGAMCQISGWSSPKIGFPSRPTLLPALRRLPRNGCFLPRVSALFMRIRIVPAGGGGSSGRDLRFIFHGRGPSPGGQGWTTSLCRLP